MNLVVQMNDLKSTRDHIVHRGLKGYDPNGHRITFSKLDTDRGGAAHQENSLTMSAAALMAAGVTAQERTTQTQQFALRLMAH